MSLAISLTARNAMRRAAVTRSSVLALSRSRLSLQSSSSASSSSAFTAIRHVSSQPADAETGQEATAKYLNDTSPYVLTTYAQPDFVLYKGEGCYLYDVSEKKYLDFTAGIAVNSLGHGNVDIAKILFDQAMSVIHTSNLYHNEWAGTLAKNLIERTRATNGMKDAARVFFSNSGTEANEAALKFARKFGKYGARNASADKFEIISFKSSFHGRTLGSLSATPNEKYQKPFAPLLPGFKYATYGDIASVEALISENTCGVIIEPIQGEGGVYTPSPEFMVALRKRCDEVDALLIYDEIQSGMGRSGYLWAHEAFGPDAHPDIMTMAKALGNGMPIGAAMVTERVAQAIKVGDHGTTFGGNPLACRVGNYVVDQIATPEFLAGVRSKAQVLETGLEKLKNKYPELVTEIRGTGLIRGVQLSVDSSPVISSAVENGLLVITAGTNTIRIVPPLVISEDEIEEGLAILDAALATL
ncbi:mitochondrial putative acetylornithine aminotransferase [Myxozyma melibiosi]|uniref:Acetylornithine aminotransferase, mitochondrial n=1 Tax=Myxozyma melibiosi TaxID=54550 RepID=A0ABR1F4L5_9ASCO